MYRLESLLNEMQFHDLNKSYDSNELARPGPSLMRCGFTKSNFMLFHEKYHTHYLHSHSTRTTRILAFTTQTSGEYWTCLQFSSGGFTVTFSFHFSDALDDVQVTAGSPLPMPQVALGLIPTKDVSSPQPVSAEQVTLQFQKKLEELEQQVQKLTWLIIIFISDIFPTSPYILAYFK